MRNEAAAGRGESSSAGDATAQAVVARFHQQRELRLTP